MGGTTGAGPVASMGMAFGVTTGLVALGVLMSGLVVLAAAGWTSGLGVVPLGSSCSGSTFVDGRGFCRRKAAAAF